MRLSFRLSDLYLIRKEQLTLFLFYTGMMIAFLGSLNPWFMWSIGQLYPFLSAMFLVPSFMINRSLANPVFIRQDYLLPVLAFVAFAFYCRLFTETNFNGYVMILFRIIVFYSLFRVSTNYLQRFTLFTCKFMGTLLLFSLTGHFLYLLGFPLPGRDVQFGDLYSYTNHYLFLLDDRNLLAIVPRFNSVFLEPSHVGTVCAFLLLTQVGQWRKWYNLAMIATIFFTFSLAAYAFLVADIFLGLWIQRRQLMRKVFFSLLFIASSVVVTFTYNNGDNLVHDLIMLRLEVDDGEVVGNNRVTENFEAEYESFLDSSDILFGRDMDNDEFGNAGYRVYVYEYGLVGFLLMLMFYLIAFYKAPDKRALMSALIITAMYFWASAMMLWENFFFPVYAIAYMQLPRAEKLLQDDQELSAAAEPTI